jgi:vancomycin resistance protein YoaR
MGEKIFAFLALASSVLSPTPPPLLSPLGETKEVVLAEYSLDLSERNSSPQINEIFVFNILHAVDYFPETVVLLPGEIFAFHPNVLPEFADQPLKTGWTKYTKSEGYQTALGLPGNGVCHLATLINWTAQEAGLEVTAKVDHNFAPVPGIPKEHGTSIRFMPDGGLNSQDQNLYVRNNFDFPVKFAFEIEEEEEDLSLRIIR